MMTPSAVQAMPPAATNVLSTLWKTRPALCIAGFVVLLLAIPTIIAWVGLSAPVSRSSAGSATPQGKVAPPPAVKPVELLQVDAQSARSINAAVPFTDEPIPAARAYLFAGSGIARERATDCLAAAMIYEAGDDAVGERAVGQVVLNRLRHPAFPKTVCGVVFQGAERSTGCQFTFTCDGAMARIPNPSAWERARALAQQALAGSVFGPVGYATHYHTDWVVPYWSSSLDKVRAVGTHLFFRWRGWWGTPGAFRNGSDGNEPAIAQMKLLSPAHAAAADLLPGMMQGSTSTGPSPVALIAAAPKLAISQAQIGKRFAAVTLSAVQADGRGFAVVLDKRAAPDQWQAAAVKLCSGRPQCRVIGWTDAAQVARSFPVNPDLLPSMAYSYIQDSLSNFQRSLWNCAVTPRANTDQCMKGRLIAPTPSVTGNSNSVPATNRQRAVFRIGAGTSVEKTKGAGPAKPLDRAPAKGTIAPASPSR